MLKKYFRAKIFAIGLLAVIIIGCTPGLEYKVKTELNESQAFHLKLDYEREKAHAFFFQHNQYPYLFIIEDLEDEYSEQYLIDVESGKLLLDGSSMEMYGNWQFLAVDRELMYDLSSGKYIESREKIEQELKRHNISIYSYTNVRRKITSTKDINEYNNEQMGFMVPAQIKLDGYHFICSTPDEALILGLPDDNDKREVNIYSKSSIENYPKLVSKRRWFIAGVVVAVLISLVLLFYLTTLLAKSKMRKSIKQKQASGGNNPLVNEEFQVDLVANDTDILKAIITDKDTSEYLRVRAVHKISKPDELKEIINTENLSKDLIAAILQRFTKSDIKLMIDDITRKSVLYFIAKAYKGIKHNKLEKYRKEKQDSSSTGLSNEQMETLVNNTLNSLLNGDKSKEDNSSRLTIQDILNKQRSMGAMVVNTGSSPDDSNMMEDIVFKCISCNEFFRSKKDCTAAKEIGKYILKCPHCHTMNITEINKALNNQKKIFHELKQRKLKVFELEYVY